MLNNVDQVWNSITANELVDTLIGLRNKTEMKKFIRDVMTEKEIIEVGSRLQAAKMLTNGEKYTDIVLKTKLSSRTIARISEWMKQGCGGYELAINKDHGHILPASAD
jgi:TrpR-related protein YerC/YecD